MTVPCTQEENIGYIKATIKSLFESVAKLDKRINGTFDTIGEHIKESVDYREKINRSDDNWKRLGEKLENIDSMIFWSVFKVFTGFGLLAVIIAIITALINKMAWQIINM